MHAILPGLFHTADFGPDSLDGTSEEKGNYERGPFYWTTTGSADEFGRTYGTMWNPKNLSISALSSYISTTTGHLCPHSRQILS
jgi:hypothetical protein